MEEIITKEKAQELIKIEGEAVGMAIKSGFEYTLQKKGKEGIKKLEDELEKLGYPIKYKEIKAMRFYPVGLEAIIFLTVKKIFNFENEEFKKLGEFAAKIPFVVRIFMRYFGSIEMIAREGPKIWKRYYTKGDFEVAEFNNEKKYAIIKIENFGLDPIHCQNLQGYLIGIVKLAVKGTVTCEETKCTFRGDDYHEFLVKW